MQYIENEWVNRFCDEAGLCWFDLQRLKIADNRGTCTLVFETSENLMWPEVFRFVLGKFTPGYLSEPSFFMMRDGRRCVEEGQDACMEMLRELVDEEGGA